jgi:hypothetical protein
MDYEKKYKEIVWQIKKAYLYAQTDSTKAVLEEIFPEIKESDDERIRKGLIKAVSRTFEGSKLFGTDVTREEALAWLEKQGEKKPALREEDEQHIDSLLKRLDGLCRNEFERTRFAINEDEDWLKSLKVRI